MVDSYAVRIPPCGYADVFAVSPEGPSLSQCQEWVQGAFEPIPITNQAVLQAIGRVYQGRLVVLVHENALGLDLALNLRASSVCVDVYSRAIDALPRRSLIFGPAVFLGQQGSELAGLPRPLVDRLYTWANRHAKGF